MDALLWHSQPAHADDLLLATQEDEGAAGVCARVVRRLSRVWVRCDEREALRALQDALRLLRYDFRRLDKRTVRIAPSPAPLPRPSRALTASRPVAGGDRVRRRAAHARVGVARSGRCGVGVPALARLRAGVQAALRAAARAAAAAGRAAAAAAGRPAGAAARAAARAHGRLRLCCFVNNSFQCMRRRLALPRVLFGSERRCVGESLVSFAAVYVGALICLVFQKWDVICTTRITIKCITKT